MPSKTVYYLKFVIGWLLFVGILVIVFAGFDAMGVAEFNTPLSFLIALFASFSTTLFLLIWLGLTQRFARVPLESEGNSNGNENSPNGTQIRRLLETLTVVPWEADLWTWKFRYLAPQVEALLGYPGHHIDFFWTDLVHPQEKESILNEYKQLCLSRGSKELEYRIRRMDGSYIWVRDAITVPKTLSGNTLFRGCLVDVNERKKAEEALRQSEEKFRKIFEMGRLGMMLIAPDHHWLAVNARFCEIVGYSQDELKHMTWMDICYPEDLPICQDLIASVLNGKREGFHSEKRYLRSDGVIIYTATTLHCHRLKDGSVEFLAAVIEDITARKKSEVALRQSEERYRLLTNSMEDIVSLASIEGFTSYVSPSFYRVTGYLAEEVINTDFSSRVHPDDLKKIQTAREVNLQGESTRVEWRCRRKDGSYLWMETTANPIIDENGSVSKIACCTRNVTDRKVAEMALSSSEARFRSVVEGSLQGIFIQQQGKICYANPMLATIFGYESAAAMIGLAVDDLLDRDQFISQQQPFFEKTIPIQIDWRGRRTDDRELWLTSNAIVIDWLENPAIVAFLRDITEAKKTEEVIKRNEAQFRQLFSYSPDAILVEDRNGTVLAANPAACRLLELTEEEFVGQQLVTFIPECRHDVFESASMFQDSNPIQIEGHCQRGSGKILPVEIRANTFDYSGVEAILLHVRDISERKELQRKLQQSEKMQAIARVTSGIAHDFNNLLTAIGGYAELVQTMLSNTEPATQHLRSILQTVEKARQMTKELLGHRASTVLLPNIPDLNEILVSMQSMLQALLPDNIPLQISTTNIPLPIKANPHDLERILVNLVINARDAMPTGGELTIELLMVRLASPSSKPDQIGTEPYACIKIRDTGEGMSEEVRQNIFEPFFTTKKEKGTGLGLFNVYNLIGRQRGHVEVASKIGAGTTFLIYLPLNQEALPPVTKPGEDTPSNQKKILIVDDESFIRPVLRRILEDAGFDVWEASDPDEAKAVFENHCDEIDLVIMDIVLPQQNGYELSKTFHERRPDLPVLFISGCIDFAEENLQSSKSCLQNILQKPFMPDDLLSSVTALLPSPKTIS